MNTLFLAVLMLLPLQGAMAENPQLSVVMEEDCEAIIGDGDDELESLVQLRSELFYEIKAARGSHSAIFAVVDRAEAELLSRPEVAAGMSSAMIRLGMYVEAQQWSERALRVFPENIALKEFKLQALHKQKRSQDVLDYLQSHPELVSVPAKKMKMGNLLKLGRYQEAKKAALDLLADPALLTMSNRFRGRVVSLAYQVSTQLGTDIEFRLRVLSHGSQLPNGQDGWTIRLAIYLYRLKQKDHALTVLDQVLKRRPLTSDHWDRLEISTKKVIAAMLIESGRLREAEAFSAHFRVTDVRLSVQAQVALRRTESARVISLTENTGSIELQWLRAMAFHKMQSHRQAYTILNELLSRETRTVSPTHMYFKIMGLMIEIEKLEPQIGKSPLLSQILSNMDDSGFEKLDQETGVNLLSGILIPESDDSL